MIRLSVNINKFATLRNARGGNNPDVIKSAVDCEQFGAHGITVHPSPDERHITYRDVLDLSEVVTTEFNIEGYPDNRYMELVKKVKPTQATLVPDAPDVLTSNAGWNTKKYKVELNEWIKGLQAEGIRTSIFVDPDEEMIEGAAEVGTDRIELYTEQYAARFHKSKIEAVKAYKVAAHRASALGLEVNAGHDLDLKNLTYFAQEVPQTKEVSIGHALICDAIYLGLENTIQLYLRCLNSR